VEDAVLTATFSPAAVVTVKLDPDTVDTLPIVPPAAGPDRAFAPVRAIGAVGAAAELLPELLLTIA
jgi:hypothetical protein